MKIGRATWNRLLDGCREAVEFVGQANYHERKQHALDEIERMAFAAERGNWREVRFNDPIEEGE